MFYSTSTCGFYAEEIYGQRRITIADPQWVRPVKTVTLQPGESAMLSGDRFITNTETEPSIHTDALDMDAIVPTIEIDNPDCKIPEDAVEITEAEHAALLDGQSAGKVITADANGVPVLTDPVPTPLPILIDRAKAKVRALRVNVFATLAGIQSQALANADTTMAKDICGLQDSLKALPDIDLSKCKTQADIDAAFTAGWVAIVKAAPANVASAFNEVMV